MTGIDKLMILLFYNVVAFTLASCVTSYNARTFEFVGTENELCEKNNYNRIALSIDNDTTITFVIMKYAGIGGFYRSVKYRMDNNRIIVDSLKDNEYVNDFFGTSFVYHKDSIVGEKTSDLFYSRKYIDKRDKKLKRDAKNSIYFVFNGRKYKATPSNIKRIYKRIEISEYNLIELDKTEAKRLYGINEKYKTLEFLKKE